MTPADTAREEQARRHHWRTLLASDAYAHCFLSLASYRTALLYPRAIAPNKELLELIRSDAFAVTFQSVADYRASLIDFLDQCSLPDHPAMNDELTAQLRAQNTALHTQAADMIESLRRANSEQQTLIDKGASLLVEAMNSEDGADEVQCEAYISAAQGNLATVGKTTCEQMLERLYDRIAATAGLPAHTEFNPLQVLDQMRVALATQQQTGAYLEFLLSLLYWRTGDGQMRLMLPQHQHGKEPIFLTFPGDTLFMAALDAGMRRMRALPGDAAGGEQSHCATNDPVAVAA